jgi:hypothetical protein
MGGQLNGRDNGRHRPFKRDRYGNAKGGDSWNKKQTSKPSGSVVKYDKNGVPYERQHWSAPKLNTDPLPVPVCTRCGQPVNDLHSAMTDNGGGTVHFDCVIAELTKREFLEEGDVISYVGAGRFGVVNFGKPGERRDQKAFTIKKILEWENKDERADWRGIVADHYSIT